MREPGPSESATGTRRAAGPGPGPVDRRSFLRIGAGGTLTATLATGVAALLTPGCAGYAPIPPAPGDAEGAAAGAMDAAPLRHLDEREYAVVTALAPCHLGVDPATEGVDVGRSFDDLLGRIDPPLRAQVKDALVFFEKAPLVFAFSFSRFTAMAPEDRAAYVDGWRTSGLEIRRQVHAALRGFTMLTYYSERATWPAIHYDGPWLERAPMSTVPHRFPLPEGSVVT